MSLLATKTFQFFLWDNPLPVDYTFLDEVYQLKQWGLQEAQARLTPGRWCCRWRGRSRCSSPSASPPASSSSYGTSGKIGFGLKKHLTFSSLVSSMISTSSVGGSRWGWVLNRFATKARLSFSWPLFTSWVRSYFQNIKNSSELP